MSYVTKTQARGALEAIVSPRQFDDEQTAKLSNVELRRIAENFCRLTDRKARMETESQVNRPSGAAVHRLFGAALMVGIGMTFVPADAIARAPITCGTVYTVTRGDTLFKIARRAFGNGKLYKQIFKANTDVLPNSASVEIGYELRIPCLDAKGQIIREDTVHAMREDVAKAMHADLATQERLAESGEPEVTTLAETTEPSQTAPDLLTQATQLFAMATLPIQSIAGPINPNASPASFTRDGLGVTELAKSEPQLVTSRIRLLTGSDLAPFVDENLPRGGMITDLVSRAVSAAAPGQQSRIAFVNDWDAHLNYLLPDGAFDVSFPWLKPDCSKSERLDAEMQTRCAEFDFSDPISEVRVGFYTRVGDDLIETTNLADLSGKRLCRPSGHFTFDLDQNGLVEPNVSVETRYSAQECFARLVDGEVDVVTLVKSGVDEQLNQLGITGSVMEIDGLETAQTLHALVSKQSPNGQANLDLVNRGLTELMMSGKWFEVVAFHQGRKLALMD